MRFALAVPVLLLAACEGGFPGPGNHAANVAGGNVATAKTGVVRLDPADEEAVRADVARIYGWRDGKSTPESAVAMSVQAAPSLPAFGRKSA